MKNHLFTLMAVALLFNNCKERDCSRYRVGNFLVQGDDVHSDNYLIRTDSTEIVYNDSVGFRDEFRIRWTDNCNYYMVFNKTNKTELMQITPNDTIFIQILETSKGGYKYKGKVKGREFIADAIWAK